MRSELTVTSIECTTSGSLRVGLTIDREVPQQSWCSMFWDDRVENCEKGVENASMRL